MANLAAFKLVDPDTGKTYLVYYTQTYRDNTHLSSSHRQRAGGLKSFFLKSGDTLSPLHDGAFVVLQTGKVLNRI